MNTRGTRVLLCAGLASGSACAIFTPRDEYVAYRTYRYETNPDRRTSLGAEYLEHYPNGRFRAQVQSVVGSREEDFWAERRSSLAGLQAYLRAYPSGSHADEARARIGVYEGERRRLEAERRAREEAERAAAAEQLRQQAVRLRFLARTQTLTWLRTLGGLQGWGETFGEIARQNPEFAQAFGAGEPPVESPGQCRGIRCRKVWTVDFNVPVPGRTARPRRLTFNLEMVRNPAGGQGRLLQAGFLFQNRGLNNWHELETQQLVEPNDQDARNRAVRWSMDQLRAVVAQVFPNACETPQSLVGPEPEMEGAVEDEDAAQPAGQAATPAPPPPIPPQPLGVQWSYVVGCNVTCPNHVTAPANTTPEGWTPPQGFTPATPHSCLRIDAYSAPDIEGVRTDEGLRISFIPPSAVPGGAGGNTPRPGGRPARPARPPRRGAPAAGGH